MRPWLLSEWNSISVFDWFRLISSQAGCKLVALRHGHKSQLQVLKTSNNIHNYIYIYNKIYIWYTNTTLWSQRLCCDHNMFSAELSYHASRPEVLFGCWWFGKRNSGEDSFWSRSGPVALGYSNQFSIFPMVSLCCCGCSAKTCLDFAKKSWSGPPVHVTVALDPVFVSLAETHHRSHSECADEQPLKW